MEYEAQILPNWGKEQQGILFKDEMSSLQVGDKRDAKRKGRARDPRCSPSLGEEFSRIFGSNNLRTLRPFERCS
jgi:hypothetical protein